MKKTTTLGLVIVAALLAPVMLAPRTAEACGGMFCDGGGPVTMRVDQTGENILYAMGNGTVEAHIQIQYTGAAARFAWVLPVQKSKTGTPIEIGIGSQRLFDAMLGATVPTYSYFTQNVCQQGGGFGGGGGASSGSGGSAGSGGGGGGPVVVQKGTAGAFDYVVLDVPAGGTAAQLMDWLSSNQYTQVPEAEPLFNDYISKGYQFVAVRLTGGAGIEEIHPLVVKYDGDTPCVPIKLTKVAAKENMGIRTFFLNTGRMVPTNYRHITLNEARVNWLTLGESYGELINNAVDSPVVDGHGFVTEFAGPSFVVPTWNIYSPGWTAQPYTMATPGDALALLNQQGLMNCNGVDQCGFSHPLVASLLHDFIPTPAGVKEGVFYNCFGCYSSTFDASKWVPADFAKGLLERVILPSKHAADLFATGAYLTRMYTTLSPAEMTEDPEFHLRADLPPVSSFHQATRVVECGGLAGMQISATRTIGGPAGDPWPAWTPQMPWVETVEDIPKSGPVIELVNNTQKIDTLIDEWNKAHGWPPAPSGTGGAGAGGGGVGGQGTGGFGGFGEGGAGGMVAGGSSGVGGGVGGVGGGVGGAGLAGASGKGGNAGKGAAAGGAGAAGASGAAAAGAAGSGGDAATAGMTGKGGDPAKGGAATTGGRAGAPGDAGAAPAASPPAAEGGCQVVAGAQPMWPWLAGLGLVGAVSRARRRRR